MAESDGYITSIDYVSSFLPVLSPSSQNFALLHRGVAAPSLDADFTYCDLGCGYGFSTALFAAANPQGRFWGIDFNPAHIDNAQQFARAAAIDNITFLQKSFAEALKEDLPPFDFITLHGVWTWVGSENRRIVLDFIDQKLKPGGVVYVSYNALPGWAALTPLRQLLVERSRGQGESGEPTPDAIDAALSFANRMRAANGAYFATNAAAGARLDSIATMPRNYVAHEYFNRNWSAFYHSDVATAFAEPKLAFAASAAVAEQIDLLVLPPQAQELLKEVTDPTARETLRDYFLNTQFRRDLFVRNLQPLSGAERNERLMATQFALIRTMPEFPLRVTMPGAEATIEANPGKVIFQVLAERPMTLAQLLGDPRIKAAGDTPFVFRAFLLLVLSGNVQPGAGFANLEKRRDRALRFNQVMLRPSATPRPESTLLSPVLGIGITIPAIDQVFLSCATTDASPPIESVEGEMAARGERAQSDGKAMTSATDARAALEQQLAEFRRNRLPIYRQLGVA